MTRKGINTFLSKPMQQRVRLVGLRPLGLALRDALESFDHNAAFCV